MDRMRRYRKIELAQALESLETAADRHQKRTLDGAISRGKHSAFDPSQLNITSSRSLKDPEDGLYWFVIGYSKVGGPDKIPEV